MYLYVSGCKRGACLFHILSLGTQEIVICASVGILCNTRLGQGGLRPPVVEVNQAALVLANSSGYRYILSSANILKALRIHTELLQSCSHVICSYVSPGASVGIFVHILSICTCTQEVVICVSVPVFTQILCLIFSQWSCKYSDQIESIHSLEVLELGLISFSSAPSMYIIQ